MSNNIQLLMPAHKEGVAVLPSTLHRYATPLDSMMRKVQSEPKLDFIYSGIKENSVGIVFGPSKSGKTMLCENLGMCIAAGAGNYLGKDITVKSKKVLVVSFEEHYTSRTDRNIKQVQALEQTYGSDWLSNYIVVNEDLPRYMTTSEHWNELAQLIKSVGPVIVFLDSLTHMYSGSIEDSKVAIELTMKLRRLSEITGATVVAIHHTHKMYGQPLSIDTIAGSRVIAQELDFMIGLNRTIDGKMYIKDVAFRYVPCYSEYVSTFTIDDNCWLNLDEQVDEFKLLSALDGRKDDVNCLLISEFLQEQKEAGSNVVSSNTILERFVQTKKMSRQTMFNNLHRLERQGIITKPERGSYSLAA